MKKIKNNTRNQNYLSLLIEHEPFKNFIKDLRASLSIPANGFKSEKEFKEWRTKNELFTEEYYSSEKYKRMSRAIRENLKDGKIDKTMANKHMGVLVSDLPINKLRNACFYIMDNFKIPFTFESVLSRYIQFNEIKFIPSQNFSYLYPFSQNNKCVTIEVYSKLTKKEGAELLKLINDLTKNLPQVRNVSDELISQISIIDWKKKKHEYDERITAREVAEDHFGSNKKAQQVYDTKRSIKNRAEKLFGK